YIAGSAAAIVVAYERESRFGVSDASRAIQGMILTAWADGVASNWTGFGGLENVRDYVVSRTPTKSSLWCPSAIRNRPWGGERRRQSRSGRGRGGTGPARLPVSRRVQAPPPSSPGR